MARISFSMTNFANGQQFCFKRGIILIFFIQSIWTPEVQEKWQNLSKFCKKIRNSMAIPWPLLPFSLTFPGLEKATSNSMNFPGFPWLQEPWEIILVTKEFNNDVWSGYRCIISAWDHGWQWLSTSVSELIIIITHEQDWWILKFHYTTIKNWQVNMVNGIMYTTNMQGSSNKPCLHRFKWPPICT